MVDCGSPMGGVGVVIEPHNDTKLDTVIIFHCQQSDDLMMAVCGINGKWIPTLTALNCVDASGNYLSSINLYYVPKVSCSNCHNTLL